MNNDELKKIVKKIDIRYYLIFIVTFVTALIAHGSILFKKISYHDDASDLNSLGTTFYAGRWMLGFLEQFDGLVWGTNHYSLPLFNGIVSLFFLQISLLLIVKMLKINNYILCGLLSIVIVAFPSTTSLFGYMFTAPYYSLAILLAVAGAYIICLYKKFVYQLLGLIFLVMSIGIYQAYIPVFLSLMLLYFVFVENEKKLSWKKYLKTAVNYVICVILSVTLYIVMAKLMSVIYEEPLEEYQNINSFGATDFRGYLNRLFFCYKYYFNPTSLSTKNESMFPFTVRYVYVFLVVIGMIVEVFSLIKDTNIKGKLKRIGIMQKVIGLLLFPISMNFIFVMCPKGNVYPLMLFGQFFIYVFVACIIENFLNYRTECSEVKNDIIIKCSKVIVEKIMCVCLILGMLFNGIHYTRCANIWYLKMELNQNRIVNYLNGVIADIKDVDGYNDELPVLFLGRGNNKDNNLVELTDFDEISFSPNTSIDSILGVYGYSWNAYLKIWCGFSPLILDEGKKAYFYEKEEVINMPDYPDEGSVKIVDGVIVVKFSIPDRD